MKKILMIYSLMVVALVTACASPQTMSNRPAEAQKIPAVKTVLFIHGMFMTPACWDNWEPFFKKHGFKTLAPAWPEHEKPIAEQRAAHPNAALAKLTLTDLVNHYRAIIQKMDEKPILVGHSMGGLVVQLLMQENLGAAGIVIDSAPPKQAIPFFPPWSAIKANWPVISPFVNKDEPYLIPPEAFEYAFVNGLAPEIQKMAYARYVVPESRKVGNGPDSKEGKLDFEKKKAPLLIIAGEKDNIVPSGFNRDNYKKYADLPSITDFREFPGRTHWIIGQEGWEEVAQFSVDWIRENQK